MSVFVAFFVLLLLLADSTPPAASSIPLIGMSPRYDSFYHTEVKTRMATAQSYYVYIV